MSDRAWLGLGIVLMVVSLAWASLCAHLADVAYQRHEGGHAAVYAAEGLVSAVCFVVNARAVWNQR